MSASHSSAALGESERLVRDGALTMLQTIFVDLSRFLQ